MKQQTSCLSHLKDLEELKQQTNCWSHFLRKWKHILAVSLTYEAENQTGQLSISLTEEIPDN